MSRQAIAVDLDGTLLDSGRALSPRSAQALLKAAERGWVIILCTARPVRTVKMTVPESFHQFYWVACNGAWILKDLQLLCRREIPNTRLRKLIELFTQQGRRFAVEAEDMFFTDFGVPPSFNGAYYPLAQLGRRDACKIIFYVASAAEAQTVQKTLPEGCIAAATDQGTLVQVSHSEAHKLAAVEYVLEKEAIALADTIAFGDDNNDLSLIEAVGCGVAMGNATAELKAVADHVAPTNDEGGVAQFLERIL